MPWTKDVAGVYVIHDLRTNKVYIGQTQGILKRFCTHRSSLKHGTHHNSKLQAAWNDEGGKSFRFRPLWRCSSESDRLAIEQWLLDGTPLERRFNEGCWADVPTRGFTHTESTKNKFRMAKQRLLADPIRGKRWLEAMKRRNEARWEDPEERRRVSLRSTEQFSDPINRVKTSRAKGGTAIRGVHLISGHIVEFTHMQAARVAGFSTGCISLVLSGSRVHHKNYRWERLPEAA